MTLIKGKQIEQSVATPQDVGTVAATGTSQKFSREDHVHKLSTAAIEEVLKSKAYVQVVQVLAYSANGASDDVTAAVEGAATNIGERNTPLAGLGILSTGTTTGDSAGTATQNYKVTIRSVAQKEAIDDGSGGEVYGVLSKAGVTWTLTYYKEDGTSYSFGAATSVDFLFGENSDLNAMDPLALMKVNQFGEMIDSGASRTFHQEELTAENITGDTAMADLLDAVPVSNASVILYLNGQKQVQGVGKDYTVSGQTITWLAGTGTAVDQETTDVVTATYVS